MRQVKYKFNLGEDAKRYAQQFLNETDDIRDESIEEIKKWLEENSKLHADIDHKAILPFLRSCKFDMEKAKTKLRNYYIMRSEIPEWFDNRNPELKEIRELVKLGVFIPLRDLHENKLVVIIRTGAHDPKLHTQNNVFKAGKMILDIATKEHECVQIYGVVAIFDMQDVTMAHAVQLKPNLIKKAVHAWQNYHCSPKQLEFVNAPVYINVVLKVFKSFMSEKLRNRITVNFNGLGDFTTQISKDILPIEYGGCKDSISDLSNYWYGKLLDYKDWFKYDEQFKADLD